MQSASTATVVTAELIRITAAPATGNPAITPGRHDQGDAAAEATCLALPTTAGTEGTDILATYEAWLGATVASSTVNPPPIATGVDLLNQFGYDDEMKHPTIRAGVLEGWAVTLESSAAATMNGYVVIEFTEE